MVARPPPGVNSDRHRVRRRMSSHSRQRPYADSVTINYTRTGCKSFDPHQGAVEPTGRGYAMRRSDHTVGGRLQREDYNRAARTTDHRPTVHGIVRVATVVAWPIEPAINSSPSGYQPGPASCRPLASAFSGDGGCYGRTGDWPRRLSSARCESSSESDCR